MRKIAALCMLLLGMCNLTMAQTSTPVEVNTFISHFEKVVMTHNYDSVMAYMDAEYVKLQYKKFLKKNAVQFIDEFFGGYADPQSSSGFTNTQLKNITAISLETISSLGSEEYQVSFKITEASGAVHYNNVLLRKYKKHLGFYGARG